LSPLRTLLVTTTPPSKACWTASMRSWPGDCGEQLHRAVRHAAKPFPVDRDGGQQPVQPACVR
jgi:hypothetical protein